jgi:phage terminase small subunit
VTEHGYELAGARGRRFVSPAVVVMNAQAVAMRQCIQEMGFSPASRARISLDDASASADTEHWGQIAMNY